jgi:hypothetical protein
MAKSHRHNKERGKSMTSTATPKIVGKALYLELIADNTIDPDKLRKVLGWQHTGTRQIIIFPEYQDDTGKVWGSVVMNRIISSHSPRSQWDITFIDRLRPNVNAVSVDNSYHSYPDYNREAWDTLTAKEKFDSHKLALDSTLRKIVLSSDYETDSTGERKLTALQALRVRDNKPIAVEITDEDMVELHMKSKTPQAVIRRINKVRESISSFPAKLA